MISLRKKLVISCFILTTLQTTVNSINCYQCSGTDSSQPFECNEYLSSDSILEAINCSSIHNAQFCVKHVGRFEASVIECYQCSSSSTPECGDGLMHLDGGALEPKPCTEVYGAKYCIKETGGISTKRFCSSLDLGNYCNYVQQPGDVLTYRTCIYTCRSDGCNGSNKLKIISFVTMVMFSMFSMILF